MEILSANYSVRLTERGRNTTQEFHITADAGDTVFIHGPAHRCKAHFEILCGLCRPSKGEVSVLGTSLYAMTGQELAAFRRDKLGVIPFGCGLIPEISMIEQIILSLRLAGIPPEVVRDEIRKRTSELLPLHSLYNTPSRVSERKQAHAAILRATINNPTIIILDRALDGFNDIDSSALWQELQQLRKENSILICFSNDPAPEQITWTKSLQI